MITVGYIRLGLDSNQASHLFKLGRSGSKQASTRPACRNKSEIKEIS
jgi:hypothetical protein